MTDAEENMKKIEIEIRNCRKCNLWKTRTNPVPGSGPLDAKIMFIGEAPGYWEDQKGEPFVGKAGKVLDELLDSIGLKREEVYITNVVKCRPPGNRDPLPEEINACKPFLEGQISLISPAIIATLGRFAMEYIFDKFGLEKKKISEVHGKIFEVNTIKGKIKIVPQYHPAVAVYNPNTKDQLKMDFQGLRQALNNDKQK